MSTATSSTNQTTTLPWDTLRSTINGSIDDFIDTVQPHAATLAKTASAAVFTAGIAAGGTGLKTAVLTRSPAVSPFADVVIDTVTLPLAGALTNGAAPAIDATVEKAGPVSKEALHKSTNIGVDLSARAVSFFG